MKHLTSAYVALSPVAHTVLDVMGIHNNMFVGIGRSVHSLCALAKSTVTHAMGAETHGVGTAVCR